MTLAEVFARYAALSGLTVDELTEAQKRQAYVDAVLAGEQIEPFASIVAWGQRISALVGGAVCSVWNSL